MTRNACPEAAGLCSKARPFAPYRPQASRSELPGLPTAPPLGELASEARLRGQARLPIRFIFVKQKDTIMTETNLTHFDASGNAVMVDVSEKTVTFREATAHGIITMNAEAFAAVESGTVKKGDVLGVARIAGIMATKRTSELIPLCHPLPLTKVSVDFRLLPERQAVEALCTVKTAGVTGVEMEALTGVSTALLTIYDMCKAVDKGMELGEIHLVEKTGGKSGHYIRAEGGYV